MLGLVVVETPSEENGVEHKQETRLTLQSSPCRSGEQSERPHDLQGCPSLLLLMYPLSLPFFFFLFSVNSRVFCSRNTLAPYGKVHV